MAKLTQEQIISKLSKNKLGEDNKFENYSIEDLIHESNNMDIKDNRQNKNVINETTNKVNGNKDVETITMSRSNALSTFGENDLIDDAHWFKQHYNCDFDLNDNELVITGSLEDLKRIIKDYHLDDIYYTLDEDTKKLKNGKWANVGKDGKVDSGTFKTKKQADAQRRAIWANWKK